MKTIKLKPREVKTVTGWLCGSYDSAGFLYTGPKKDLRYSGTRWELGLGQKGKVYMLEWLDYPKDIDWPPYWGCVRATIEVRTDD